MNTAAMWRTAHPFCAKSIRGTNLFNYSPTRDLTQIASTFKSSPVALEICWRHAHFSTKTSTKYINPNRIVYTRIHRPTFTLLTQFLYPMMNRQIMLQRSFTSQYWSHHKQTGSYSSSSWDRANRTTATYMTALAIAVVGLSYAAVPLYRIFCQASGYGGTVSVVDPSEKVENMEPLRERELTIRFNADTSAAMRWQFKPHQREIKLVPGETALAFYTARNPTDKPITGMATYNVIPFEAGLYFNKIQCFCFEEQRLNPREQVDMPVFFYIDPDFNDDPAMAKVDTITLSYTFFEAKEGEQLTLPLPQTATNS